MSPQAKEQISRELSGLDTGLPELDFKSLEEKLSTAAKEHEESERRKLGDEVFGIGICRMLKSFFRFDDDWHFNTTNTHRDQVQL